MTRSNTSPNYLVVAMQPLVAQDIAAAIGEELPGARVITAESLEAAAKALAGVDMVDVAFVEAQEARFAATPLAQQLTGAGTRIVLIGQDHGGRWVSLPIPFALGDLADTIRKTRPALWQGGA